MEKGEVANTNRTRPHDPRELDTFTFNILELDQSTAGYLLYEYHGMDRGQMRTERGDMALRCGY